MIIERVKIEKRQLVKMIIFLLISVVIFEVSTAPIIICKIECSTCPGGVMDQDFTKVARSLKGKKVEVLAKDGRTLNFKNCYALKKKFFSRHFVRIYDLEWSRWF